MPSKVSPLGPSEPIKYHSFVDEDVHVQKTSKKSDISVSPRQVDLPTLAEPTIEIVNLNEPINPNNAVHEIEQHLEMVEAAIDTNPRSANSIIKEKMQNDLKKLLAKEKAAESVEDGLRKVGGAIQLPSDIVNDFATEPFSYIEPFLEENVRKVFNKAIMPIVGVRTGIEVINFAGAGAVLIAQALLYQQAKNHLNEKKIQLKQNPADVELRADVNKIEHYVYSQLEALKDKIVNFASSFADIALKVTSFVFDIVQGVAPLAKGAVGWAVSILDVITEAITLWRANKAKTSHEAWMQHLAKDQRSFQQAEELLSQRCERMIMKKANKLSFQELTERLHELGIEFNGIDIQAFKTKVEEPDFKKLLMERFLSAEDKNEDTINVMTRNAVQSLAETKVKNERKFFNFKLSKAKINLTLACLASALAITLEILAIVGIIALSASMMAVPGLGFFVLGIALTGIGLYFFHKYKPNLFKCYVRGVNLRIAFMQVPAKIRQLQLALQKKEIRSLEIASIRYEALKGLIEQNDTLNLTSYPKEFHNLLKKLQKSTAKRLDDFEQLDLRKQLDKMKEELELKRAETLKKTVEAEDRKAVLLKKVESWVGENGSLTRFQNQLKVAGNKDFAIANRLLTTAKNEKLDIPMVIIEKILDPNFNYEFDEETLRILKTKMDIDLGQIPQLVAQQDRVAQSEKNKAVVKNLLEEFFKMDDDELLTFMRKNLADRVSQGQAA